MDAKEVKTALKNAREAVRKKEFKEVLKHCKAVLKQDKSNYNALVFVAVAAEGLDQPDQALNTYRRAIEVSPEQPTAWQGICSFYEKNPTNENKKELVHCYQKLMEFFKDNADKVLETGLKLGVLHQQLSDLPASIQCYQNMLQLQGDSLNQKCLATWVALAKVLGQQKSMSEEFTSLFQKSLEFIVSCEYTDEEDIKEQGKMYIKYLLKNNLDEKKIMEVCGQISERCPDFIYPHEITSILMMDRVTEHRVDSVEALCSQREKLCKIQPDSGYNKLLDAATRFIGQGNDFILISKLLQEGLDTCPHVVTGWVLLCQSYLHIWNLDAAEKAVNMGFSLLEKDRGISSLPKSVLHTKLCILQVQILLSYEEPPHSQKALEILEKMKSDETNSNQIGELKMRALIMSQRLSEAQELYDNILSTNKLSPSSQLLQGRLLLILRNYSEATEVLMQATRTGDHYEAHFLLGKIYWELRKQGLNNDELCFQNLLKAAKLNPYYSNTFLYLAFYYEDAAHDVEKACKCFQKAFNLNSRNDTAGSHLVDTLVSLGDNNRATTILVNVTSQASASTSKWAWLRLGLQQLKEENFSEAIESLQCALRADPKDVNCWECLGDSYANRGSYSSAIKAYVRTSELNPDAVYPLYQIASIKQLLGFNTEAAHEYKLILDKKPSYVPALKGLGESNVALARGSLNQCFDDCAVDYVQKALNALTQAGALRPDLSCVWKLLGDACTILHPVSNDKIICIPSKLVTSMGVSGTTEEVSKLKLLSIGAKCYGMSLKLMPDCSELWHDLGVNYVRQAQHRMEKGDTMPLSAKAMQVFKKALTVNPSNHKHWNALGLATSMMDDSAVAQHCFIRSVEAEANNVWAWTNLGVLYIKTDQIELAHEAFKVAQSLNPTYVQCWIGQAVIAEIVGHEDAMDLFRHCTELANHMEASLGYAHWVCATLQDKSKRNTEIFQYYIHNLAAIPAASDCLARYTARNKSDPVAYNLHGLLLEKQNLNRSACDAFHSAVLLIEKCSDVKDSALLKSSRINYARSLHMLKKFDEAILQYQTVESFDRVEDIAGLGLAYFNAGKWADAFKVYQEVEQLVSENSYNDISKIDISTALGITAYKYGDGNEAKTYLFSASQVSFPSSVPALLALCALSLKQKDDTLCKAVLQELEKVKNGLSAEQQLDVCSLGVLFHAMQGDEKSAKNKLAKNIRSAPWEANQWLFLGRFLVYMKQHVPAFTCVNSAVALECSNSEKLYAVLALASIGSYVASPSIEHKLEVIRLCQKAVHTYPASVKYWCCLQACLQFLPSSTSDYTADDTVYHLGELIATIVNLTGTTADVIPNSKIEELLEWSQKTSKYYINRTYM